jgi:hypothetical protein
MMGADHPKPPAELEQYLTLVQQRDREGLPFVIVGDWDGLAWTAN